MTSKAHIGQDSRLGDWNLVLDFRILAQRLKLALRGQPFEVALSIQQDSIGNLLAHAVQDHR
jgi:hypothetical protein